ncbi:transposase [Entomoplasma ellychniae]|uniref:Transposase n=1 Tax=Entomoplasma ellychniae TaxID=2114 RepID=A0A8E2QVQ3_9MOLU|nr:transposase [Entomoplasma ellychniae]
MVFNTPQFEHKRFAKNNNLTISLSNPGCFLDNAACETFFSQLKTECPEVLEKSTFEEVCKLIDNYINYYNYTKIRVKSKKTTSLWLLKSNKKSFQKWNDLYFIKNILYTSKLCSKHIHCPYIKTFFYT